MDDLKPGEYGVIAITKGFPSVAAKRSIGVISVRDIKVVLRPLAVYQAVASQAQCSSITTQVMDLACEARQSVVSSWDFEELPLTARGFANNAYLAPGTELAEPSDPTKARITAVSIGGGSGLDNELPVDGGDDSDRAG